MDNEGKILFCLLVAAMSGPVFTGEWKASVVKNMDVLVSSCVVVPCSFTHPRESLPRSRLRGVWHRSVKKEDLIYYDDQTRVLENFRGRTKLLGDLGQSNCTLEIKDIKDHDNGPFCFRIELARTETDISTTDKFSFVEDCVSLNMLSNPPRPEVTHSKEAIQDHHYTIVCSVTHTCPSHRPTLKWSRGSVDEITVTHRALQNGVWEAQSMLTFTVREKDDHTDVTCTAQFEGGKASSVMHRIYVKRIETYNHIIIPTVVGIGTALIFGVLCIFTVRKYKRHIAQLQNQDGSMWNRLSRLSRRFNPNRSGPARPDHRRPNGGTMGLGQMNNVHCAEQTFSKPRFPSPKSQPKSCSYQEDLNDDDDYLNTAELNIYGNVK